MEHKTQNLLQDIYLEHLKDINGVNLTRREVDLIAFYISGRSTKKIASFFSIAPKTVENHTHNIMVKLKCNSREAIIDFVEKSDKLIVLRKYYAALLSQSKFDASLKAIAELLKIENPSFSIVDPTQSSSLSTFVSYLESNLKHAGLKVSNQKAEYLITLHPTLEGNEGDFSALCSRPGIQETIEVRVDQKVLNLNDAKAYFLFVFSILKTLFPEHKFEKIISGFESEQDLAEDFSEFKEHHTKKVEASHNLHHILRSWKWTLLAGTLACLILVISFVKFEKSQFQNHLPAQISLKGNNKLIRSDLDIPLESALLKHAELLSEISKRFKEIKGIQTIALVGIGGAGKTTIARRFANSQESSVVWEINAQTNESINESFESLAQALAQTEEDEKRLRGIIKIKGRKERDTKVIQFVKERLQAHQNWFLIYDDVEKFSDIQRYFPIDPSKWGQGKVIITTQDSTIENNTHVNYAIFISELKPEDKLDLFLKIMSSEGAAPFTSHDIEEAKKFLAEIPPFPLDVSVAAYYIKATHVSYKDYLENMLSYNKDFSHVQEEILQQAGDYTKTRYGIIKLSLKQLLDTYKEFKELLLLVSLLDSQNISRNLLIKIKDASLVDNFIYRLRQYSLIQSDAKEERYADPTFSIHRSTQSIALAYLINKFNLLQDRAVIQPILIALERYMAEAIDTEDFSKMRDLYMHAEQVLTHTNLLEDSLKASIGGELGCIYYYLCDYIKAEKLLRQSIELLSATDPKNYAKIARFHVYLGSVHKRRGDYEKAKKLFEKSFLIYKKAPEIHVGMAKASGYLGVVYETLGDFSKAKSLLEESLRIHKKFPQNQIGLAWSLAHLGSVYKNLGDFKKAKELYKESYSIYKTFSNDYVGAAWACIGLGSVYMELGDFKEAKAFLDESLAIYNKHFVEEHVYVARALTHLGILYRETGEYEKAKTLLKKSLSSYQETYGKQHSETGWVMESLGKTYLLAGDYENAEKLISEALDIFKVNKSSYQYVALEDLATLYEKKSMKVKAISNLTQALENVENSFPKDSPHYKRIQAKIAKLKIK